MTCRQETTYYATLAFAAIPVADPQPEAVAAPTPIVSTPTPVAFYPTTTPPVYLAFPFRCIIQNGEVVLAPTDRLYYHQALDYRPAAARDMCPTSDGYRSSDSSFTICRKIEFTALRLVCKGGIVSAPQLTLARKSPQTKGVRLQGDTLLVPISNSYYPAPAGFGILPHPDKLLTHEDFVSMYDPAAATRSPAAELPSDAVALGTTAADHTRSALCCGGRVCILRLLHQSRFQLCRRVVNCFGSGLSLASSFSFPPLASAAISPKPSASMRGLLRVPL